MITLFTGNPGSGKTYRVVYDILREALQRKYFVVHDVKGLVKDGFSIPAHIKTHEEVCEIYGISLKEYFTADFQAQLGKEVLEKYKKHVLVVIDEAWRFMGVLKHPEIEREAMMGWLAQHRHYGQDVWLITQNLDQIHRSFLGLIGERIHAKKGKVFGKFLYGHSDVKGNSYRTSYLRKDRQVFAQYKSFETKESAISTSKLIPVLAVGMVCFVVYFVMWIRKPFGDREAVASVPTEQGVKKPAVKTKEAPGPGAGVESRKDTLADYSYSAKLGDEILVQRIDGGGIRTLSSLIGRYSILEVTNREALISYKGNIVRLLRQGVVVEAEAKGRRSGGPERKGN